MEKKNKKNSETKQKVKTTTLDSIIEPLIP